MVTEGSLPLWSDEDTLDEPHFTASGGRPQKAFEEIRVPNPHHLLYRNTRVCRLGPGVLGWTQTLGKPSWTEGNETQACISGSRTEGTKAPEEGRLPDELYIWRRDKKEIKD